jgi:fatty-acid desaturase
VQGLRRSELDPSGLVIALLERLGLASDVVRITPERQRQRETSPAAPRGATGERA